MKYNYEKQTRNVDQLSLILFDEFRESGVILSRQKCKCMCKAKRNGHPCFVRHPYGEHWHHGRLVEQRSL